MARFTEQSRLAVLPIRNVSPAISILIGVIAYGAYDSLVRPILEPMPGESTSLGNFEGLASGSGVGRGNCPSAQRRVLNDAKHRVGAGVRPHLSGGEGTRKTTAR